MSILGPVLSLFEVSISSLGVEISTILPLATSLSLMASTRCCTIFPKASCAFVKS